MASEKGPAFRILIGDGALGRARAIMWASLCFGVIALGFGGAASVAVSGFFAGVFVLLFFATRYVRTEQTHCAFCDRTKADVKYLVSAPACSICEACAPLAVEVVAEREATGWMTVAQSLPKNCPWNVSSAVIEALVVAPDATPTALRQAATLAWRLQNMAAAERAYGKIPETDRIASDWLSLGVAVGKQGRHDEAIAITARVERDEHAPWVKNNLAWFSVRRTSGSSYRASAAPSREEAEGWIRDLDDARKTLLEKKPAGWEDVRQRCLGTRAEIQRVTGDLEGALASLESAKAEAPLNGEQLLCRARVLAARGDKSGALADAKAAVAAVHPESNDAAEAHALVGEVG